MGRLLLHRKKETDDNSKREVKGQNDITRIQTKDNKNKTIYLSQIS